MSPRWNASQKDEIRQSFRKSFENAISKLIRRESKELEASFRKLTQIDRARWRTNYRDHFSDSLGSIYNAYGVVAETFTRQLPEFGIAYYAGLYAEQSLRMLEEVSESDNPAEVVERIQADRARFLAELMIQGIWEEP